MLAKLKCRSSKGRPPSRNESSAKPSPPREQRAPSQREEARYAKSATG